MTEAIIADKAPKAVTLEKDRKYYYCTCGRSTNQPFCDGSHKGTDMTPQAFSPTKDGQAYLCQCKHTGNPPYCDGTHARLGDAAVGQPAKTASHDAIPPVKATKEEPAITFIHQLAREGLAGVGRHGPVAAMGVPRDQLPRWDDLQLMVEQLAIPPLPEDFPVATELVIGPKARKPLVLKMPILVSDMSFGALSEEAKVALARGAEMAGTGICSGEGGMLPEEQAENSRYLYELGSAKFGYDEALLTRVQAFHFKAGQAAKAGIGGHLPGEKNQGKISQVRGIPAGEPAISPPTFTDMSTREDYRRFADRVREITGGIPVGFKMSANHIERDIQFAVEAGADYIILDGRGGGTGAAPLLFRDHISVPTIPALARARRYLQEAGAYRRVTLIITGGLRTPTDFVKALALGADGVAIANSAIQAIGCIGARICHTNNCPSGVATQKEDLRQRLSVDKGAQQLANFLTASVALMQMLTRACGHKSLYDLSLDDLATWHRDLAFLSGVRYAGYMPIW